MAVFLKNMLTFRAEKVYKLLASLNLILPLVGYNLVTSLFSQDDETESQLVTIPFRAITFLIAILCIVFIRPNRRKFSFSLKLIFFYWGILILRFYFDVVINQDLNLPLNRVVQIALYMVCLTIVPSIALIRTYYKLDLKEILYVCYCFSTIAVIISFVRNPSFQEAITERLSGNASLGSIGVGQMGLTNLLFAFVLLRKKTRPLFKLLIIAVSVIAFFILIRSGSRGPILTIIVIISFCLFSRAKRPVVGMIAVLCFCLIVYFLIDYIIDFIDNISPILKRRLFEREDQTSDRVPFYMDAINSFISNPIIGTKFGIYGNGEINYPHNIFLESLMQLGVIGGVLMIMICILGLKYSKQLIVTPFQTIWVPLLFLQSFTKLLVSSSFSTEPSFTILFVLLALINNNRKYSK